MTDQDTENMIQVKGANVAPRITPADIEANIVSEHYFTARQGVEAREDPDGIGGLQDYPTSLDLLTFCVLVRDACGAVRGG